MKKSKHLIFYILMTLCFTLLNIGIFFTLLRNKKDQVKKEYSLIVEKAANELELKTFQKNIDINNKLANNPLIIDSLNDSRFIPQLDNVLEFTKNLIDADIVYLMNNKGDVISSSTYNELGDTLTGNNYSFRKYFFDALKGEDVIYPAVGTTTYKRGLYFSTSVFDPLTHNILGVLTIKAGLEEIDKRISDFDSPASLISKEGVIFSTNKKEWLYKTIRVLSEEEMQNLEVTRQFSDKKIEFLDMPKTKHTYFIDFPFLIKDWSIQIAYESNYYNFTPMEKLTFILIFFTTGILIFFIVYLKVQIWKKKELEKELKKYFAIVEQAKLSIIITDKTGIIEYVNPEVEKITGYPKEEILGKKPNILKSGKHNSKFYNNLWETLKNKETWINEIYNRRKDGSFYWERAIISPLLDRKNNILNYIAIKDDITAKKTLEEELKFQANMDEMTQTLNKRSGLLFLEKQLYLTNRAKNESLSVCYIDINDLKVANDNFGHNVGDQLILNVIQIIKDIIRISDTISRFGGDEFLVIFPNCNMICCLKIMERVLKRIEHFNMSKELKYHISISYGINEHNSGEEINMDKLIQKADEDMYQMKRKIKEKNGPSKIKT